MRIMLRRALAASCLVLAGSSAFAGPAVATDLALGRELLGVGFGFLTSFANADACLSTGEAARGGVGSQVPSVLGGIAGGVAGTAVTGSVTKGAAAGGVAAAIGGLLAPKAEKFAGQPIGLARERDRGLCEIIAAGDRLLEPVLTRMSAELGPSCGLFAAAADADVPRMVGQLHRCAESGRNARLKQAFDGYAALIRQINQSTCRSGYHHVVMLENEAAQSARRTGESVIPTLKPDCDGGADAARAWYPLGQPRGR